MIDAVRHAVKTGLVGKKIQENLGRFIDMLDIWRDVGSSDKKNHIDLVEQVLDDLVYRYVKMNKHQVRGQVRKPKRIGIELE